MMKLEKAIKQKRPFESLEQRAGVNLIFTHNWLLQRMKKFFAEYGVTVKQYNIMRILKGADGPVSTSYIKERLLEKNSDVSRIVDRMYDKQLIQKRACPADKRLVDVSLNKKGEKILQEINSNIHKTHLFFTGLDQKELETLNILLDKMRE